MLPDCLGLSVASRFAPCNQKTKNRGNAAVNEGCVFSVCGGYWSSYQSRTRTSISLLDSTICWNC